MFHPHPDRNALDQGDDTPYEYGNEDDLFNQVGADRLYGYDGDETLENQFNHEHTQNSLDNNVFYFGIGEGNKEIQGKFDLSEINRIELSDANGMPGDGDWILTITEGYIKETLPNPSGGGLMILTQGSSGTITLSDGSTLDFSDIQQLSW